MKVLVKHSFEIWEEWPKKYATKGHIEFYYNEGTSCADNIIDKILNSKRDRHNNTKSRHSCTCHMQSSEVLEIKK